ncbi:RsfA family transcriptional regulator [Halobacillus shinanisalinarum]|uniref:RsfA family transcriptional regulator n=1 Tax=Halobacillus shinanisalinarum TaxID=2932258 RepID=A0ABY4H4C7_9BACI|nr:RsfA family transcriptional regulator [Halobacillus shinanisalinarum]UOQ93832.1 RsfA family transcriptional regulator [Halobacillus shinanisalinarum]
MPKVRQDAWSHEDDLLLAETVLRHIREGSTQLRAFEEVGDLLNRTSAACGFRWNAEVRQKYEQAVELAKKQRKEKKRNEASMPNPVVVDSYDEENDHHEVKKEVTYSMPEREIETELQPQPEPTLSLSQIIKDLKAFQKESSSQQNLSHKYQALADENKKLASMNQQLTSQLNSMTEDYQALIQIMDRARKMVMFDDQDYAQKPQFRMEKNGNLEHVAR